MSETHSENSRRPSQFFAYFKFLLFMFALLVILNIAVYFRDFYSGLLMSLGLAAYLLVLVIYYFYRRRKAINELVGFAAHFSSAQTKLMEDFAFPYVILDKDASILWGNAAFIDIAGEECVQDHEEIFDVFPDFEDDFLPKAGNINEAGLIVNDRFYRLDLRFLFDKNDLDVYDMPDISHYDLKKLYAVSFFDETELREYIHKYQDETLVTALLYLDNYEETLEMLDDIKRSIMMAVVDRKLSQYFGERDIIIRRFERDKYIVMMRNKSLEELKDGKFTILQEMRNLNVGNDMSVTVSMGVGMNQGSYIKNLESARIAIDLALGRGGDQAVIKDGGSIQYFGGKAMAMEKNTKVKARVKAHALYEFMSVAERVVILGHRMPDADSVGASVGVFSAARSIGKKAYIVIDAETPSIKPIMNSFQAQPDHYAGVFINCEAARNLVDANTLLVIVDTSSTDIISCPELLNKTKSIVILDHHRISSSLIQNTVLSYIEPYASSTCEMTAEILQYFPENIKLRSIEADAMYAGITVDTDNFILKTGVRTFEAAAYLRRCGADAIRVRKMMRDDISDYLAREKVIGNAELYRDVYAISCNEDTDAEDPTVVGAQAANSLLNIKGVKASFVLTEFNGTVFISARSIDEVNVQIIMERLGGGGHINIAGAQMENVTVREAEEKLKDVLDLMIEGGDI